MEQAVDRKNGKGKTIHVIKMEPYEILISPLTTEKSVRLIEAQNELIFIVNPKANKKMIKHAIEKLFKVKVKKVRTLNDSKGRKKAYVRLHEDYPARDIGTKLGLV